mmetsp:Transcript_19502/g.25204  ORF Transcript_19502/g.25204 Transcript_19502/m.25204 type:complete len:384 (+) Transcript_19502:124-1275(+)
MESSKEFLTKDVQESKSHESHLKRDSKSSTLEEKSETTPIHFQARKPYPEFLVHLVTMVKAEDQDIITWEAGNIHIRNPTRLLSEVLQKYFRHANYNSFKRQLNYFGFRKISGKGKMEPCTYANEELKGDSLEEILHIKRKRNLAQEENISSPSSPDSEKSVENELAPSTSKRMKVNCVNSDSGYPAYNPYIPYPDLSMKNGFPPYGTPGTITAPHSQGLPLPPPVNPPGVCPYGCGSYGGLHYHHPYWSNYLSSQYFSVYNQQLQMQQYPMPWLSQHYYGDGYRPPAANYSLPADYAAARSIQFPSTSWLPGNQTLVDHRYQTAATSQPLPQAQTFGAPPPSVSAGQSLPLTHGLSGPTQSSLLSSAACRSNADAFLQLQQK